MAFGGRNFLEYIETQLGDLISSTEFMRDITDGTTGYGATFKVVPDAGIPRPGTIVVQFGGAVGDGLALGGKERVIVHVFGQFIGANNVNHFVRDVMEKVWLHLFDLPDTILGDVSQIRQGRFRAAFDDGQELWWSAVNVEEA